MTSDHNPGKPTARRRMAGYTPLADPPGLLAKDSGFTSAPSTQEPRQSAPASAAAGAAETTGQLPQPASDRESGAPLSSPTTAESPTPVDNRADSDVAAQETTVSAPPVRKRRMGGSPLPVVADSAAATSAKDTGATATAEKHEESAWKNQTDSVPGSTPAETSPAVQFQDVAPVKGRRRMGSVAPMDTSEVSSPAMEPAADTPSAGVAPTPAVRLGNRMAAPSPAGAEATTVTPPAAESGRVPAGRPAWVKPVAIVTVLVLVAAAIVFGARSLRTLEGVQAFIATYDGHSSQPASAPEGMPSWMGWQHFLNMFFIVLLVRTGLQVRTERKPPAYWTAKKNSFFAPKGNSPKKVSLSQWLHQCLDVFWVANGLVFVVLLFATGQWMRIVPTDWDIVPNMVSGAIQYASLDWPLENGWVHYNALQVMAYFVTVFVAAPLAVISGLRFSTWWPEKAVRLNRVYPVEWARAVHFPVMLYFVAFTIVHIFLVFFTGALRNLNHMYTSRDVVDWWGLAAFLASLAVVAAVWFLTQPLFTTPIATRMGKVTK